MPPTMQRGVKRVSGGAAAVQRDASSRQSERPTDESSSNASSARRRRVVAGAADATADESVSPALGVTLVSQLTDFASHFVATGAYPQNYVLQASLAERFADCPPLFALQKHKLKLLAQRLTAPVHLRCDLSEFALDSLGCKFDVIVIDPPLPEYARRYPGLVHDVWTWKQIGELRVPDVAATVCFVFLWVGNAEGLEEGRHVLRRWGFRRCEEITWCKTNVARVAAAGSGRASSNGMVLDQDEILVPSKEHCLVGVTGPSPRRNDGSIVHSNIDIDVIIDEERPAGDLGKPAELYRIIENFVQGRRRLELFGTARNIRPGWLTLGRDLPRTSNFEPQAYSAQFEGKWDDDATTRAVVGTTARIEEFATDVARQGRAARRL